MHVNPYLMFNGRCEEAFRLTSPTSQPVPSS
jgi:hypothetical protein